jgi:anti-sigma B factor antagonist
MAELDRPAPLQIAVDKASDRPLVTVSGELDGSNIASLQHIVDELLADRPHELVFDLSDLHFMDTSGLAVLITASKAVPGVRVLNPSKPVRTVINMTGLAGILVMEP